jgi:hypothetical protein
MNIQKFTIFKTILIALVLTISTNQLFAQTTNGIFFQAVARDNFSNPAKDRKIYVQSSIIQTTPTGTKVLTEEHQANTDATGVFSISLGNGVRVGGTASGLATIDWSKGPFYLNLKVAITPIGGNSNWDYTKEWVDMGTTSFGAVPFALYSASSAKVDDKLNVSDTTTMLKVYAKAMSVQSLETSLATKLTAADTLTMLAPYAKAAYTIDSSFFKTQLATKLSLADSTKYVTPTQLATKTFDQTPIINSIATKLNIADSTKYVTPTQLAAKTFDQTPITNAIATKLNIADSTKYITPTQLAAKTFDTTSLSSRINLKLSTAQIGAVNGVASLDASGLIPSSQLPPISFTSTTVVSNDVDMVGLSSATVGSIAIRTDLNKNFVLSTLPASTLTNWVELLTPAAPVQTVNGYTGSINLSKVDIDLGNVNNTSDINKPVSTATQAALDLKLDASKVGAASGVASLNTLGKIPTDQIPSISFSSVKVLATEAEMLALSSAVVGSVVIRTDINKNYVLAQADPAVLTNWIQLLTPAPPVQTVNGMTGDITITKTTIDLANVNNTSDASKPVSTAAQTALGAKADTAVVNPTLLLKAPLASPKFTGAVAIGTTTPASSAVLDITSSSQGLLLPRLTYVQKTAISSPVAGLILFCSDCGTSGEMQLYNGTSFVNMIGSPGQFALPGITSTTAISGITTSSATSGGVITSDGGATVTARGIVWGTSTAPTVALATKTTNGTGVGTFTSSMTGLTSGVTYYVRAYATNSVGTKYGSEISFNTSQAVATLAATTTVSAIGSTTATSGGNITYNGGATVTVSGIVWSTTSNPTIALTTKTTNGAANGAYTITMTGLTPGTLYYVRSYATNSVGTNYGAQTSFTTLNTPTITATASATSITSSTATTGGTITADGGASVTSRGVVYGTSSLSSTFNVTTGTGTGTYTSSLTGLTPATTYYVRSFATNSVGTVYGTETSFTTNATAPTLTTTAASSITKYAASAGGTISSNGGSVITASGICWSTTATPTTSDFKTTDGTTTGIFTSALTGLTAGTTYYVRAYATNAIGTGYGATQSFTTLSTSSNNPVLASTTSATSITSSSAILGGNVTDEGATQVSVRGLVYGTTTGASTFSVTLGSGAGTFTGTITGLTQGTTYFVRSFATNVQGTSYGAETSFTTQTTPTLSATTTPSSITTTSAIGGGTISSSGGATITTSGLVWGASTNPEITLSTKTTNGATSGTFTSSITGLTQGTTYYVRAYATNYLGTSYGPNITFTTITTPTVSATATVTSITGTTATGGGTITADGGATVTSRGVVYGTSSGASTYSVTTGTGTGTYTTSLTGLTPVTTYYVRSFATNSVGTVYGTETSFTTSAGPASKAMITTEPSGAAAGTAFTIQPVVRITDASGNTVTTSTVNVVASIASGTGTLSGTTTVAAVNGVATFTNLVLLGATGNFTLAFTPTSLTAATSNSFALSFGTASKAMITTHPSGAVNGVPFTIQPVISVTDASGNTVTSSTVNLVASIASGTGGTLSGTTTVAAVNGVATFTNLVLSGTPGNFTLAFTPTSLTAATSNSFALSVGTASKVMVTTQPSGAFNGIAFSTQPVVKITDAGGNTITSSTANVVATIASGSGTLGGTTAVNAVAGVANFTNLKITGTGNHTLTFTPAGGLTAATSNTVNVAVLGCAQGGACAIGDTGPGGGKVFYYSAAGFQCGPNFSSTCYYLEVAPNTWSGGTADPSLRWDPTNGDDNHVGYPNLVNDQYPNMTAHINASEIGLGYKSSVQLFNFYGDNSDYAAGAARRYTGGGKTDWYLGTSVEMNLLADWSKGNPSTPTEDSRSGTMIQGGFSQSSSSATHYWTASQLDWATHDAYRQDFLNNSPVGGSGTDHKSFERKVRPIRAF